MNRTHTRTLATLALLCAMEIILARFCVIWITNSIKITFEAIPILMAGILFGPAAGAVVGAVSDILGAGLLSGLGWLPVLTVTPTLLGLLAGLLRPIVWKTLSLPRLLLVTVPGFVLGSMFWTTWWLSSLYGTRCLPCWPFVFRCTVSSLCWIRSCSFSSAAAASSAAWDCGQSKPKKEGMLS